MTGADEDSTFHFASREVSFDRRFDSSGCPFLLQVQKRAM